jgi:hypothetical protein
MPIVRSQRLDELFENDRRRDAPLIQRDELFRRAAALKKDDRLLLELAFKNNLTVRQLAEVFKQPPGTISRRLRRVARLLREPIVTALLDENCDLLPEYRLLAVEYFVQGMRLAELSELHQMSILKLRDIFRFVRVWLKGTRQPTRRSFAHV